MAEKEDLFMYVDVGDKNSNKVWRITQEGASITTKWGRVGDALQSKTWNMGSAYAAEAEYNKKCKEKIRKGYEKVEAVGTAGNDSSKVLGKSELASVALQEINCDSDATRELIKYLTEQNIHQILENTTMQYNSVSGVFTTPLGVIVGQNTIDKARGILANIKAKTGTIDEQTNQYLRLIPQNLGRARNKLDVNKIWALNDDNAFLLKIQQQADLLDSLEASLKTVLTQPAMPDKVDEPSRPRVFDCKLHLLNNQQTFNRIKDKFESSKKTQHFSYNYRLDKVYEVDIKSMTEMWLSHGSKLDNIMELWHGTSAANLLSILKRGLVIPGKDVPVANGSMFGAGAYFAPASTKSLNYASGGVWSNKVWNKCWMFLGQVSLGNYYVPNSSSDGPFPKKGYDSVWAKVGKTRGLLNDECIVYDTAQCNLIYLCEFVK